jgi:tRNA(His) 5'-end guanylyltransferase
MQTVLHIPATSVFTFSPLNIFDQRQSLVFYSSPVPLHKHQQLSAELSRRKVEAAVQFVVGYSSATAS